MPALSKVLPLYSVCLVLFTASLPFAGSTQTVLSSPTYHDPYAASIENAKANANIIFNAIHSASRQWGSSVHHNGLSMIPVTVPEGTLLYHGNPSPETPDIPEWLAFEIEHAELFARKIIESPQFKSSSEVEGENHLRHLVIQSNDDYDHMPPFDPGYLHIYQANRPLRLLYFDGMSAATASPLGTTDMQEYTFMNRTAKECCHGIFEYAAEMCKKAAEWGVEGFVRMEAGFEIIKCDFSEGLDFISHKLRPSRKTPEGQNERSFFGWTQAVALRYDGIDSSRIIVDFSSMVHAGFYSTNLTNPSQEFSHLPRLISADPVQLARINSDAKDLWLQGHSQSSVDWQGAVDMIEKRYSNRLQHLAIQPPYELFLLEINILLNTFIDYQSLSSEEATETCASHYLRPIKVSTEQDKLIYAAIETVTTRICTTLFEVRADLLAQGKAIGDQTVDTSRGVELIHQLIQWLDWSEWKKCRPSCRYSEVCYISACPYGTKDLHDNPRCLNSSEIEKIKFRKDNYWFPPSSWAT